MPGGRRSYLAHMANWTVCFTTVIELPMRLAERWERRHVGAVHAGVGLVRGWVVHCHVVVGIVPFGGWDLHCVALGLKKRRRWWFVGLEGGGGGRLG